MTGVPARTLGTAGHIDHGKTALVRALTGVDTDRLPEERERGISIALGYASLPLPSGRVLSVVDVPGHERFVRTMIAGATGIDLALLVVACDDGVMPQTREHVAILELLAVRSAVVALSKRDLVDAEGADLARADVEDLLEGTGLAGSPIVETSARTGAGLDELRAALEEAAASVVPWLGPRAARLPIDRAFTLHGIGTVVTGTLWSGAIAAGDRLAVLPGAGEVRVRSVEVHDQPVERAEAGQRVAASLAGVERSAIPRGATLATARRLSRELPARRRTAGAGGRPGRAARHARAGADRHRRRGGPRRAARERGRGGGCLRARPAAAARAGGGCARRPPDRPHHRAAGDRRRGRRARPRSPSPRRDGRGARPASTCWPAATRRRSCAPPWRQRPGR